MSALPLHIWTFILAFRDFDWVAARTNSWDAVGVIAYGLIFALVESVIVFATAALLGFLISTKWDEKRRIALMSVLVVTLSLWSIFDQMYFLRHMPPPEWLVITAIQTARPLVFLYGLALVAIMLSTLLPAYFILRLDGILKIVQDAIERFSLLMIMYLVFDLAAVIIIIIRNL